ncbi:TatD family hydrolase [Aureimonas jatrophae]|uniref:TatD DNase family protein n=1 Tax=Aureimonas jatrophae TaxID=1166073 RepID=A0A1H0GZA3_9HYPH|nr:TatD family hydrolase [Aureimonas jatrophae]MBB3949880.1 TatD DNase family protein [Aureimonas jatrophae]SDO12114.1 TatD DNase family protein [Aureimonas jatrophae]
MPDLFLVDSHCHLDFADFTEDRDAIVERARQAGVGLLVTISTRVARFADLLAITRRYDNVFASVGTHPLNAAEEPHCTVDEYIRLSSEPRVVAIGEAGLDYHYDRTPRDVQMSVFRRQIEASRETQLPLVIHARAADADMEAVLVEESGKGAFPFILHCFSSGPRLAAVGVELGGYVSFSGIAAFPKSDELRKIAAEVPRDRLLIETDAPYLAPPPYRGKRNEPAHVVHTATRLADALGLSLDELGKITSDNFFRLFRKVPDPRTGSSS